MDYTSLLTIVANWAAILTAVVAVLAYGQFLWTRARRKAKLEAYLKSVRHEGKGQKTLIHLMRHLSMSESDVMEAGFRSTKIQPFVEGDDSGKAVRLLFSYVGTDG